MPRRAAAVDRLPEFEALRDSARDIKNHTLAHLDLYLEAYEQQGRPRPAATCITRATPRRRATIFLDLCQARGAKARHQGQVDDLRGDRPQRTRWRPTGIEAIETDLGEYIIQLRDEAPSHIIAPAIHVTRDEVEADFRKAHRDLPARPRPLAARRQLLAEARGILRQKFLSADIGVTGANFLIAETGTSIIVTNEGNGDLTQILPKVHVVIASSRRSRRRSNDAAQMLRVLARSATGQDMSVYTTLSTGPRRPDDPDGPEEYHVVLLDNGRSAMLAGEFEDMLRCIRCGACMNHCPVYQAVGGHAYGWVYPGPMGAVLTPSLIGVDEGGQLPNASTFCGRCEAVCPMRIPLPKMMRHWREREFERHLTPAAVRYGLGVLGVLRQAAGALPLRDRSRDARAGARRPRHAAASPGCRSPAAGRATAISPRRRARRSRRAGAPRAGPVQVSAARDEIFATIRRSLHVTGAEAPRRAAVADRLAQAPPASSRARQGDAAARIATFKAEAARARPRRSPRSPSPADVPAEIARYLREHNLPATLRIGADPRLAAHALGRDGARGLARRRPTATISTPSAPPSPASPRPARWRSSPAPTIRRRSISCPTIISSSCSPTTSSATWRACSPRLRAATATAPGAAHAQFRHRPVALGRHRADAAVRRARAAPAAHRDGGRRTECAARKPSWRFSNPLVVSVCRSNPGVVSVCVKRLAADRA